MLMNLGTINLEKDLRNFVSNRRYAIVLIVNITGGKKKKFTHLFEAPRFFLLFMLESFALPYAEPSADFLVGTGILK